MIVHDIPEAQIAAIAAKAKATLPLAVNGRIEKACRLVRSASVELHDDGSATVISESDGFTGYLVQHGQCTCPDFEFQAPKGWCAHRIAVGMTIRCQQQARGASTKPQATSSAAQAPAPASEDDDPVWQALAPSRDTIGRPAPHTAGAGVTRRERTTIEPSGSPDATSILPEALKPHIVYLHGKPFVHYAGLLALAHARGLVSLKAHFISVTAELALAEAEATFADGKTFAECADATPGNVGPQVKAHYARMALTRAKARTLRDALNVGICTLEEVTED
jgi:hypothetical protein